MQYRALFIFASLSFNLSIDSYGQNYMNTDTVGLKTVSDNIYNKPLFADSLASSFIIVIKKEVKLHKHLYHSEHIVVLEGNGQMQIGGKLIEIKKGDVV